MNKEKMDQQLMTREESYAERRQLFKEIWETSINMDEKENIMTKPKVIKTLRLSEMDRCVAKKKKKQKLKNLRMVCNKLLDFCDRQEADDLFYEQMAAGGNKSSPYSDTIEEPKVKKKLRVKKKIKNTKSLFATTTDARLLTSERKRPPPKKITRYTSPIKVTRTNISFPTKIKMKSPNPRVLSKNVTDSSIAPRRTDFISKRSQKSSLKMPTLNIM